MTGQSVDIGNPARVVTRGQVLVAIVDLGGAQLPQHPPSHQADPGLGRLLLKRISEIEEYRRIVVRG